MNMTISRSALYSEGITLHSSLVRLFPAAFLTFWLCGWLAGEVFVAGVLFSVVGNMLGVDIPALLGFNAQMTDESVSWFVLAFMLVWLTFWTFGGVFALRQLWKLLIGRERLFIEGGRLTAERFRGPLVRRQSWDVHQITAVENDGSIAVNGRKSVLVHGGTSEEKCAIAQAVADAVGVSRPLDWPADDASTSVRRRRRVS